MKLTGACHCGNIKIEGEADPATVSICHCTDCQTTSSAPFRISIPMPGPTFKVTGQPTLYVKTTADSGNPRVQAFCPKCGTSIYSTSPGEGQQPVYIVRVGILEQRGELEPKRQIWHRSSRPWIKALDGIPKLEKQS